MVIESSFWREDLAKYAKAFRPVKHPPRWSERLVVNFEKDVTIALFIVRRLAEARKFSSRMEHHRAQVFRCAFNGRPHRFIFKDIHELYQLEAEEKISKDVGFICNQFIHANLTYATRDQSRNWESLYTCSDFEKRNWLYKIPVSEIIKILELAIDDYPKTEHMRYNSEREDWIITTD